MHEQIPFYCWDWSLTYLQLMLTKAQVNHNINYCFLLQGFPLTNSSTMKINLM